jgi:hypothetical protein
MIYCVRTLAHALSFRINTDIHWRNSVQSWLTCHDYIGHNARQAPATADTSNLHGIFVDIDAMLLGS